jgi:hypothetical protein
MNSTYLVFSIINNIEKFISGKDIDDLFIPFNPKSYRFQFQKTNDYFMNHYKRIYNDIENCYYSQKDMVCFCLYRFMFFWENKINLYEINQKNIEEFLKTNEPKRIKEDIQLLKDIHTEFNFKSRNEFINPKEDGSHILYILLKNGRISIMTYLNFIKKVLTESKEDVIFNNMNLKRFRRISIKYNKIYSQKI